MHSRLPAPQARGGSGGLGLGGNGGLGGSGGGGLGLGGSGGGGEGGMSQTVRPKRSVPDQPGMQVQEVGT